MDLKYIRNNFKKFNKKTEINIGNNRLYKIIGMGPKAFKVLKFEKQEELGKGGWSQVFWNYKDITDKTIAFKVIEKLEEIMKTEGGQTTL